MQLKYNMPKWLKNKRQKSTRALVFSCRIIPTRESAVEPNNERIKLYVGIMSGNALKFRSSEAVMKYIKLISLDLKCQMFSNEITYSSKYW